MQQMASLFLRTFYLIALLLVTVGLAIPKPENEKKSRVYDKPLSDEDHYKEGHEHNPEYDHEAFLGEEEAKSFDQMTPEESKERLIKIVEKIDKDNDGYVTHEELQDWINYTQRRYIMDDVTRQWVSHNPEQKDHITWEDYQKVNYGFMNDVNTADDAKAYKEMMEKDKRRWTAADKDKDGKISKEEFADFLHPEEASHMHDVVITETLDDIDKDKDGKISLDEYIGDMYSTNGEPGEEPDWVKNEREQFSVYRDKNKDGYMDKEEVAAWIIPSDYNHSEAEAKHLIYESDANKDNKLSVEEILDKYDLFVGSQATDYGEALTRHDEF